MFVTSWLLWGEILFQETGDRSLTGPTSIDPRSCFGAEFQCNAVENSFFCSLVCQRSTAVVTVSSIQIHGDVWNCWQGKLLMLEKLTVSFTFSCLTFFTLLMMAWNKLLHGQFFLLVIMITYYVYPQTDYCRSTLFWLFLPINFNIFFNTSGEDSHPYSTNSLILSVLTVIIFLYKVIYSERW